MKIILLPGAGCRPSFYDSVTTMLSNCNILTFKGKTLEAMAADLASKLTLEDNEDFIVVAHCFSGLVLTKTISNNLFKYLRGVVLCNSILDFSFISREDLSKNTGEHPSDYAGDPYNPEIVLEAQHQVFSKDVVDGQLDVALSTDLRDLGKYYYVPVLVLGSDKDGYFSVERFKETQHLIPNSKLVIVKNARHLGLISHRDEYLEIINNWSSKLKEVSLC